MPVVIRAITEIERADDVEFGTLGPAKDGYSVTYDDGTSKFILSEISSLTVDTRANILASSPSSATLGFTSDTFEAAIWDGSGWYFAPLELNAISNGISMGLLPPMVFNDRSGYNKNAITDKIIYNTRIGGNSIDAVGSIRVLSGSLQTYSDGAWNDIGGLRFQLNNNRYVLDHRPFGFTQYIDIQSGNSSLSFGLNGLPTAVEYQVSMGAYPVHQQIIGRSITV